MPETRDLFDFMIHRVKDVAGRSGLHPPQAFMRWFIEMYYLKPHDLFVSDGPLDGKFDAFFKTDNGAHVVHHIVNAKYTRIYNKLAPQAFYAEITSFAGAFLNKASRAAYLEKSVSAELRPKYKQLFTAHDQEKAELLFLTNLRRNPRYADQVSELPVQVLHLEELLQHLIDDIDGAMPRTPPLFLSGIHAVLSADRNDTEASTSIVFARLIDFIKYMNEDPYDLLFARNVRIPFSIARSPVNREIQRTFRDHPKEFAYSNNGITVLCDRHTYDPGSKELKLENPRVVNGSQTLHTVRDVANPSSNARVMVRVIEIAALTDQDLPSLANWKRDVIARIAVRSNQQNPIKKWNLVSNDDFQMGLFRHFRRYGYFYERRDGEWRLRSRELHSAGIHRGIGIKKMAQLIGAYFSHKRGLGAANAKVGVGTLFDGDAYENIRDTPPELAFQLFMIDGNLGEARRLLAKRKKYIDALGGHIDLALAGLVFAALRETEAKLGDPDLTRRLKAQWQDGEWHSVYSPRWRVLTKQAIDQIVKFYKREKAAALRRGEGLLTYNNYFKSSKYVDRIFEAAIPSSLRRSAWKALAD